LPIDVRITPEPTPDERSVIVAAVSRADDGERAVADSQWRSVALRENVEGDLRNDSEPAL
jgi:hypothetical protein